VVVGSIGTNGDILGLIDTLSGGIWTSSTEIALPTSDVNPDLSDVACSDVGDCVAVGGYVDQDQGAHGLIEALADGTWTPTTVRLPAGAERSGNLLSVACEDADACVAVGGYIDSDGDGQGLIETLSGGDWTTTEAPVPANAATSPRNRSLSHVACSVDGSCAAGGSYTDTGGLVQILLEDLTSGTWKATEASIPAHRIDFSELDDVACPGPGVCVAVGSYNNGRGFLYGAIETLEGISPTISSAPRASFVDNQPGSFTLTATGSPVPSIFEKDKLPPGLRFTGGTGSATISGTPAPATSGRYLITIEASNGLTPAVRQYLTLTIKR